MLSPGTDAFRGSPPGDTDALEDLPLRISAMVADIHEISITYVLHVNVIPGQA